MIKFYSKRAYGIKRYYLKDKKQAEAWRRLTGTKTLKDYQIKAFKNLVGNIKFQQVAEAEKEF